MWLATVFLIGASGLQVLLVFRIIVNYSILDRSPCTMARRHPFLLVTYGVSVCFCGTFETLVEGKSTGELTGYLHTMYFYIQVLYVQ